METIKKINIKNQTYYFYNNIINLNEFDGRKIKVDKKDFNNIDIYYLGYEHKKKIAECDVINSANPIYLRIVDMNGQFEKGKDDAWYLIISDDDDVYKKLIDIFESLKNKIIEKRWHLVKYDKHYMTIKFESNNIGFINLMLKRKTLTEYTNLFLPNDFTKNDDIILNYFMNNT